MPASDPNQSPFGVVHAGRTGYAEGYSLQQRHHETVLAGRESGSPQLGRFILTEHDPVVTVTRRPGAADHVLLPRTALAERGVELAETDRGGDVTYHGPGQLVCYPIVDLNRLGLRLHDYMRSLEEGVIRTLDAFGVAARRDPGATGVWVDRPGQPAAKVCALGVRVRRWVSMHGLAINVDPDMSHFGLIVPCGLAERPVVSLRQLLNEKCPTVDRVADELVGRLGGVLLEQGRPGRTREDAEPGVRG